MLTLQGLGGERASNGCILLLLGGGCVSRSHGGASHQMPLSGGPSHTLASVKWSGFTSQWNLLGTPCLWPSMIRQAPGAAQFSAAHRDGVGSDGGSSSDGSTVASPICHFCDWLYLQGYQKSFCGRQAEVFAFTVDDLDLLRAGVPLDVLIVVRVTFIGPIQECVARILPSPTSTHRQH